MLQRAKRGRQKETERGKGGGGGQEDIHSGSGQPIDTHMLLFTETGFYGLQGHQAEGNADKLISSHVRMVKYFYRGRGAPTPSRLSVREACS